MRNENCSLTHPFWPKDYKMNNVHNKITQLPKDCCERLTYTAIASKAKVLHPPAKRRLGGGSFSDRGEQYDKKTTHLRSRFISRFNPIE